MLDMLRWHGAEEVEHKAVAFDVMKHLQAGYWRQVRTQLVVSPMMLLMWVRGVRFMYSVDRDVPPGAKPRWRDYLERGATRPGARAATVRAGHRRVLPAAVPPVATGRCRAGGRLPGHLTRRARLALSLRGSDDPRIRDSSDGVTLAVHAYTEIDSQRPTVLAIHGYPDNHHLWDGVAEHLSGHRNGQYNFVAYDVRGAGESTRPAGRSSYLFPQLVSDIGAVIDSLGVGRVHLLAHDWGSIQAWAAVTDETVMSKVASFTSISGPHLNYAGKFLRSARSPRAPFRRDQAVPGVGIHLVLLDPGLAGVDGPSRCGRETR